MMATPLSVWLARLMYATLGALVGGYACWLGLAQGSDWPPYQAETILLIDQTSDGAGGRTTGEGIEIAQRTLQVAVTREPIRSAAIARINTDWNVEEVTKRVRVEVPEGVPMIKVVATDADPVVAASIADAFALEAERFQSSLGGASVLAPAKIPKSPVATSYLLVVVAAMIGSLLAVAAMWFADQLRQRVRTPRDAEALVGVPLLGALEISVDGRVMDATDHDWIFVRLMNGLEPDQRTVLFTSPKDAASQTDLLRRLLSTDLGTASLGSRAAELEQARSGQELVRSGGYGSTYHLDLAGHGAEVSQPSNGARTVLEVLDGPPALTNPSTILSSRRFDGVVLVLEAGQTTMKEAQQTVALLREAHANLIGSVLVNRTVRVPAASE